MTIFCLEDFKVEFEKLKSKKNYNSLGTDIIGYFFGKTVQELCSGTRLNNSDKTPYLKKRLKGSGGFRLYFLIIIKDEKLFLMFVHPKTGPNASENITDDSKAYLYKKILNCIKINDLYRVELSESKTELIFTKLKSTSKK